MRFRVHKRQLNKLIAASVFGGMLSVFFAHSGLAQSTECDSRLVGRWNLLEKSTIRFGTFEPANAEVIAFGEEGFALFIGTEMFYEYGEYERANRNEISIYGVDYECSINAENSELLLIHPNKSEMYFRRLAEDEVIPVQRIQF
jgi:hypothetical protein